MEFRKELAKIQDQISDEPAYEHGDPDRQPRGTMGHQISKGEHEYWEAAFVEANDEEANPDG